jgi:hypothetical protein
MLDISGYTSDRDLSSITVIEPACGEGAFVIEIISRLYESARRFHFDPKETARRNLVCFDIDGNKIQKCIHTIVSSGFDVGHSLFRQEDFLLAAAPPVDLIIGNPPYVRHEQIPEEQKEKYKKLFPTFRHRADLYIPFYEKSLQLLKSDGKHCFICSNRWLKNQYGYGLRNSISSSFNLRTIVNLERINPFEEDVIAYPAISLIVKETAYSTFEYADIGDINTFRDNNFPSKQYVMPHSGDWSDTFNIVSNRLELSSIEDMGFKVGIGVATGADKIFIGCNLPDLIERELLLPILTSKDVRHNKLNWSGNYLFNPFDDNGHVIDISRYPKAQAYMESHRKKLQERHVSKKNPANWYRTIDRIYKDLLPMPKILLPDISANDQILIDKGQYYPHHNMYYITGNGINQLKILGAVLMSDFIVNQLSQLANSMNGGYSRWQSQYVRKLKLPDIHSIKPSHSEKLISYYDAKNRKGINSLVNRIVG